MTHNGYLPPGVGGRYASTANGAAREGSMGSSDLEARLRAVEAGMIQARADQSSHEKICAERYDAIRKDIKHGMDRLGQSIKWLAITVGVLALVVTGQATLSDLVRSGAARIGVTVQAAPGNPPR